jgi:hypothetical protein
MRSLRILVVAASLAVTALIPAAVSAADCTSYPVGSGGRMSSLSCDNGVTGSTYCYGSDNRYCNTTYSNGTSGSTTWSQNGKYGDTTYSNGSTSTTYCWNPKYCSTTYP